MNHGQPLGGVAVRRFDRFLQRSQHQRQRGAEFVADIGKERGFRQIDLRQGFRAPALRLIRPRRGKTRCDLGRNQFDETGISLIERAVGIERGDEQARLPGLALLCDRHDQQLPRRDVPPAGHKVGNPADRVHQVLRAPRHDVGDRPGQVRRVIHHRRRQFVVDPAGFVHPTQLPGDRVGQIDHGEGQVFGVAGQGAGNRRHDSLFRSHRRKLTGQVAQCGDAAFAHHPLGFLHYHAQHAGDLTPIIRQRTVGKRMVGLFRKAAALQEQQQALVPGRLTGPHHRFDPRPNIGPDFRPDGAGWFSQRPWMLDPQGRRVGVVVEEREVLPPGQPHLVAGGNQDAQNGYQALRPGLTRAQIGV